MGILEGLGSDWGHLEAGNGPFGGDFHGVGT